GDESSEYLQLPLPTGYCLLTTDYWLLTGYCLPTEKREQLALLPLLFGLPLPVRPSVLYICPKLEDELHCQLHVATLDVAVRRYAFNGSDKSAGNVLSARSDVKICVVEGVEHLAPKLQRVSLTDSDVARNSSVNVPIARTTKL